MTVLFKLLLEGLKGWLTEWLPLNVTSQVSGIRNETFTIELNCVVIVEWRVASCDVVLCGMVWHGVIVRCGVDLWSGLVYYIIHAHGMGALDRDYDVAVVVIMMITIMMMMMMLMMMLLYWPQVHQQLCLEVLHLRFKQPVPVSEPLLLLLLAMCLV